MQVHSVIQNSPQFGQLMVQDDLKKEDPLSQIMGFCHNILEIKGELFGDILEIEMLKVSPFDQSS